MSGGIIRREDKELYDGTVSPQGQGRGAMIRAFHAALCSVKQVEEGVGLISHIQHIQRPQCISPPGPPGEGSVV